MKTLKEKIEINIIKGAQYNLLDNQDMVELIQLLGDFLNLKTIPDFAAANMISYQGASKPTKTRKKVNLFNVKFVIDNY